MRRDGAGGGRRRISAERQPAPIRPGRDRELAPRLGSQRLPGPTPGLGGERVRGSRAKRTAAPRVSAEGGSRGAGAAGCSRPERRLRYGEGADWAGSPTPPAQIRLRPGSELPLILYFVLACPGGEQPVRRGEGPKARDPREGGCWQSPGPGHGGRAAVPAPGQG